MKGHYHPAHGKGHKVVAKTNHRKNHALRAIMDELALNTNRYKVLRANLAQRAAIEEEIIDRSCDALIMRHRIGVLAQDLEAHRGELAARLDPAGEIAVR